MNQAYFIGPGNQLGEPISVDQVAVVIIVTIVTDACCQAREQIFGLVIMNDWSGQLLWLQVTCYNSVTMDSTRHTEMGVPTPGAISC